MNMRKLAEKSMSDSVICAALFGTSAATPAILQEVCNDSRETFSPLNIVNHAIDTKQTHLT